MTKRESSAHAGAEGTIRFAYGLEPAAGPVTDPDQLDALRGWRAVLRRLALLGQDPGRYDGLGFGNLSARDPQLPRQFVITASQTSGNPELKDSDLVRILQSNPGRFWVDAVGHQPPSSETLTHAMVYHADPTIGWVLHVHSPEIWRRAEELELPATAEDVGYGTPAMVTAVAELLATHRQRPLVFVTRGHEDGVFACGASAEAAAAALVAILARSLT